MISVNRVLNTLHEWSAPQHHPLKRMAFTRLGSIVCLSTEITSFCVNSIFLGLQTANYLLDLSFKNIDLSSQKKDLWKRCTIIFKFALGVISTAIFGLVVSPEINFHIHLKLGLAIDHLSERKRRELNQRLAATY